MAKKKNPEQEGRPAEEQEVDTPSEDTEEPQEETPTEDQEADHQEESEEQEDNDTPEDDQQEEQQPDTPAQDQPGTDEVAELRRQLLEARGQNAAYAAGVAPDMVEDAVTLAMAEAAKAGEVTEAAITKAMEAVLKRHPEWKASDTGKTKGGFKLGFDRDNGSSSKNQTSNTQNQKRWNRFK